MVETREQDRTRVWTGPLPDRVQLFVTCLVDQFKPEVGESVVNVLERLGVQVDFPEGQTCCGQPAFNSGFQKDAQSVALRFIEAFEDAGEGVPVVVPSGSCGAMVRVFYEDLFANDPANLARARRLAERVWEFSEFLVDVLGVTDVGGAWPGKVTYHQCCHLLRELHVDRQPRTLLDNVEGLGVEEMEKAEVCCGFGGTFSIKFPEISTGMMNEKLDCAARTGAKTMIAGDTGCIMHMVGGLRRRGSDMQILHLAQLLDQACSGERGTD
ncbi:MAG: (Fe-S)-binding protein [Chloroflexota bacterium]